MEAIAHVYRTQRHRVTVSHSPIQPATRKLKVLKTVVQALNNVKYTEELIEKGVFTPLAKWLCPNPETGALPNITIRNALIKIMHDVMPSLLSLCRP